jgi:UDPglucose 6-dehydrogenase
MANLTGKELPDISVIGLGKLGAPLAAVFASKGYNVIGVDLNNDFVTALNEGRAPVLEPKLQDLIDQSKSRLRATLHYEDAIVNSDVTFIIVPTPSGRDGIFVNRYVTDSLERIGSALRKKQGYHVVVVTSTVIPGSMEGELTESIEKASGRTVGVDLGFCYNPEFIALGSVVHNMLFPDMILIGQSDERAGGILEDIYRRSTESNPEFHRMNLVNSELCKISVNTFVTTKISYANMIADMCDHLPGADADVVTRAVGADSRIGRKYLKPATGYGGPCFPRDNKAFSALARRVGANSSLAEATDNINNHQISRLLKAVKAHCSPGDTIAILGLSYKPDTGVIEESQGILLAARLADEGYKIIASDPLALPAAESVLRATTVLEEDPVAAVSVADVIVVMTPWPEFAQLSPKAFERAGSRRTVIDPWSLLSLEKLSAVADVVRLGTGSWNWQEESSASQASALA